MPSVPLRVVIAGGGTGGHLYPGLAVARALRRHRPDAAVTFVGTASGLEARVVPREGWTFDRIRSAGLKGKSLSAFAQGLGLLPLSALDAWRVISRRTPDLVIGVGGYSSGPVVLIASLRGIPTLLLEQNAAPGLTNRLLARVVSRAAVTYDVTLSYFHGKGFVSGNPVREEFFRTPEDALDASRSPDAARILIFGGSQGAHALNLAMVAAAPELAAVSDRLSITHQTGERDLEMVRDAYQRAGVRARVEPFLFEMDAEMTAADLVVSRAGATTLAELAAAGRPAILVPFPHATDDHQRKNAQVLADAGAAEVIDQRALTGPLLVRRIVALIDDAAHRRQMAAAMRRFARADAADVIVSRALQLVKER